MEVTDDKVSHRGGLVVAGSIEAMKIVKHIPSLNITQEAEPR
jgi:hypothetical protein